jgi:hypothetical protein
VCHSNDSRGARHLMTVVTATVQTGVGGGTKSIKRPILQPSCSEIMAKEMALHCKISEGYSWITVATPLGCHIVMRTHCHARIVKYSSASQDNHDLTVQRRVKPCTAARRASQQRPRTDCGHRATRKIHLKRSPRIMCMKYYHPLKRLATGLDNGW